MRESGRWRYRYRQHGAVLRHHRISIGGDFVRDFDCHGIGLAKSRAGTAAPLIGGHLLSTLVGLLIVKLCGPMPWAAALAVGLAMIVMHLTGTFHPPAGIDPLVVVVNNMSWSFLVVPVAVGALLLALFAFTWHNLVARGANRGDTWPTRWW